MEPACVAFFDKIRTICAHQLLDPTVKLASKLPKLEDSVFDNKGQFSYTLKALMLR